MPRTKTYFQIVMITMQMTLPGIPLFLIIIPLLVFNILVILAVNKWQKYREMRPRFVADSSFTPIRPSAAIPSPRMATVTTPLNPKQPKQSVKQSKKFCDELAVDDGSSSFFVPENFKRKPLNGKLSLTKIKDVR